ncbi:hypothetical protein H257_03439 [Aphanomyces astaci]|uniref:Uncharacterized protein n=1 Tax=Aphanomyces astaci TaxID=112090 RepID=W4GZ11_APHAT|nr:hypothetical protein H257_03439 [Aphanomyces astaci]ETV84153.1 hypothetical protein H257_03439 [Aphanomyces astaci]|eukprot:XP_009825845.1 hypothetical protein H257_03439 [Aphanomyces astaci]
MQPTVVADKAKRYAALKQLYDALQEDHVDLARRYTAVKQKITHISSENEYLVDELCRYTESDFDSDSDDGNSTKQTFFTADMKVEKVGAIDGALNDTRSAPAVVKVESKDYQGDA